MESELFTVKTSLRDCVIAWCIVRDRFNNEVHHEFSTSEEIKFFDECEAHEFINIMEADGLEAWI
jgi:hypothetical protein